MDGKVLPRPIWSAFNGLEGKMGRTGIVPILPLLGQSVVSGTFLRE